MKKLNTIAGCKLFVDGKHIKTVPARYENVVTFEMLEDLTKKRPTKSERF